MIVVKSSDCGVALLAGVAVRHGVSGLRDLFSWFDVSDCMYHDFTATSHHLQAGLTVGTAKHEQQQK